MKIIAGAILVMIEFCAPFPLGPLVYRFLVLMRAEELAEALISLKELERLEKRAAEFEAASPEEAQAQFIFEIRFEIVACVSSIRRITQTLTSSDEFDPEASRAMLEEDLQYFHRLVAQRQQIEMFDAVTTKDTLVNMMRRRVEEATERFEAACAAYQA